MENPSPDDAVNALEARLLISFTNRSLALAALTHKTYANEHPEISATDNQRLEFLGDAVVDLAISHLLMERFPEADEGELSQLRALIVNEEALARVARALSLGDILLLGRGEVLTGGRQKSSVLADALEGVIGAVYLCAGWDKVLELVDRHFAEALAGAAEARSGWDYKTMLQIQVQNKMRLPPRYRVVSENGPPHERIFEVEVAIGPDLCARAVGRSKKEGEQAAARAMLAMVADLEKKR